MTSLAYIEAMSSLQRAMKDTQEKLQHTYLNNDDYVSKPRNKIQSGIHSVLYFSITPLKDAMKSTWNPPNDLKMDTQPSSSEQVRLDKLMEKSHLKDYLLEKESSVPAPLTKRQQTKLYREQRDKTSGPGWFNLARPAVIDEETEMDLKFLSLRSVVDPKHFWKKPDKKDNTKPEHFEVGTLVANPIDFYSDGRSKKKMSRGHFVDDILKDQNTKKYLRRKFMEINSKAPKTRKTMRRKTMKGKRKGNDAKKTTGIKRKPMDGKRKSNDAKRRRKNTQEI